MAAILGVDVGGTFTDFLFWEGDRLTLETPGGGGWGRA